MPPEIEIVPFEPAHLDGFVPGALEREALAARGGLDPARWRGLAVSLQVGGATVGIVGLLQHGGVTHAAALFSDGLRARPMALHRLARRFLDWAEATQAIATVEAWAAAGDPRGRRWLCRLGFTPDRRGGSADGFYRYVMARGAPAGSSDDMGNGGDG